MDRTRWIVSNVAVATVVVAWSETLYYPTDSGPWLLAWWYLPVVVVALRLVPDRAPWWGVALAGWLLGSLVEGTLVPVLYEAVPWSLVNTSLGWHALVSVATGTFGLGLVLRARAWWATPLAAVGAGLSLGLWWPLWLTDGPLPVEDVLLALGTGTAAVALGHAVLAVTPVHRPPRAAALVATAALGLGLAVQTLAVWFAPLVLLAAVAIPVATLRGTARERSVVVDVRSRRALGRLPWLALLPPVGASTFATSVDALGADDAAALANLGVFAQMIAGTVLAVAAVVAARRAGVRPNPFRLGARSTGNVTTDRE